MRSKLLRIPLALLFSAESFMKQCKHNILHNLTLSEIIWKKITFACCLLNTETTLQQCASLCFDHIAELLTAIVKEHLLPGVLQLGCRVMIQ